jgi:hypothetical protein
MTTSVFNLSAIDRIELAVNATYADTQAIAKAVAMQGEAIVMLTKTLTDFVIALGGGDQPAIDAATAALQNVNQSLAAAVGRDQST